MPHYQPFWCEENIWLLAGDPEAGPGERQVVLVTGPGRQVACWSQRCVEPGEPALWDYHVILTVRAAGQPCQAWDLDTRLPCPGPLADWLAGTFPCPERVPAAFQPRLLTVPAATWRRDLWSDRSHMRRRGGGWQQEPPPWRPLTGGSVPLSSWLARAREADDLAAFRWRFGLAGT